MVAALGDQWRPDEYVEVRARLRRLAFDDLLQDEDVPKLVALMRERGWIGTTMTATR